MAEVDGGARGEEELPWDGIGLGRDFGQPVGSNVWPGNRKRGGREGEESPEKETVEKVEGEQGGSWRMWICSSAFMEGEQEVCAGKKMTGEGGGGGDGGGSGGGLRMAASRRWRR